MDIIAPPTRAAQYLRMSKELQRYSIEHQAEVIAGYAQSRGYEIVRTYADPGRSGVQLRGRPALSQLLADVVSGEADFSTILALDVTRWGRFQDLDEAAHYEFICRSAGVAVEYCAEPFENDGSIYSGIIKQLKRVMAAEYSRELSEKIARALRGLAAQGYRMSGVAGYGLRRMVLDEMGLPGATLMTGQRKAVQGHRIMLVPGPPEEVATVRRIYHLFVVRRRTMIDIARILNAEGLRNAQGRPWTPGCLRSILTNEKYIGNNIFGYLKKRLGQREQLTSPDTWVRFDGAFPALVDQKLFLRARGLFRPRYLPLSNDEMLEALRQLWRDSGMLTHRTVQARKTIPCANAYAYRFGSLGAAFCLIGYDHGRALSLRHCDLADDEMLTRLAALLGRKGKLFRRTIDADPGLPSTATYVARFGSLSAAYERIGYVPCWTGDPRRRKARKYSDAAMIEGLKALHAREGFLSSRLIDADPELTSYGNYVFRFGPIRQLYGHIGLPHQRRRMSPRPREPHGRFLPLTIVPR